MTEVELARRVRELQGVPLELWPPDVLCKFHTRRDPEYRKKRYENLLRKERLEAERFARIQAENEAKLRLRMLEEQANKEQTEFERAREYAALHKPKSGFSKGDWMLLILSIALFATSMICLAVALGRGGGH